MIFNLNFSNCYLCLLVGCIITNAKQLENEALSNEDDIESWTGKWFPFPPTKAPQTKPMKGEQNDDIWDGCDDGEHTLHIDFDPTDKRHSYNYLCLSSNKTAYQPNLQTPALLTHHFVPPAYRPPIKCMNESISYEETLPIFGAYRPLPPKYGTYRYLPPQRWLHSLAQGSIVFLYHPCANSAQVQLMRNALKSCLYRHIVTPSIALTSERPMALLSWGKSLKMSVMDDETVRNFITTNAKRGLNSMPSFAESTRSYKAALLEEAHLVTDTADSKLCAFTQM